MYIFFTIFLYVIYFHWLIKHEHQQLAQPSKLATESFYQDDKEGE